MPSSIRWMRGGAVAACLLAPAMASAAEAADPQEETGWSGEAELGFSATGGNSDTSNLAAKLRLQHRVQPWRNELRLEALHTTDQSATTAEQYIAAGRTEYRYPDKDFLFGNLRYDKDRFSGYDYQFSETLGYGARLVSRPEGSLEVELGVGGRHSESALGVREDEAILRGAGRLYWQLSPTARFTEDLLIESGSDNTFTESVTALKVKVNGNLGLKASLTVQHNSAVPAGTDSTDTVTGISLAYDF